MLLEFSPKPTLLCSQALICSVFPRSDLPALGPSGWFVPSYSLAWMPLPVHSLTFNLRLAQVRLTSQDQCRVVLAVALPTPVMEGWREGPDQKECVLLWKWIVIPS